jgi:hypothetical protein
MNGKTSFEAGNVLVWLIRKLMKCQRSYAFFLVGFGKVKSGATKKEAEKTASRRGFAEQR